AGKREDQRRWTFTVAQGGTRRVEVTGQLGRPLFSGFKTFPDSGEVSTVVRDRHFDYAQVPATKVADPAVVAAGSAQSPAVAEGGKGKLTLHCDTLCSLTVDGLRQWAKQQTGTVELAAGKHEIEARDQLNSLIGRGPLDIPDGVEVFVFVSKGDVKVTNTK